MKKCHICTAEVSLPTRLGDNYCDYKCEEIQDLRKEVDSLKERLLITRGESFRKSEIIEDLETEKKSLKKLLAIYEDCIKHTNAMIEEAI